MPEEKENDLQTLPFDYYPRPQLRRDNWFNLNGQWRLTVRYGENAPASRKKETGEAETRDPETFSILVPYCPESRLSSVELRFSDDDLFLYEREFSLPENFVTGGRVLLHFGAVDQVAEVFLNGVRVGHHEGGYEHFTLDITEALRDENALRVVVKDRLKDGLYPSGKQKHDRGGMWYTPVTGIWQTVWIENVPDRYVGSLSIRTRKKRAEIRVNGVGSGSPNGEVILNGKHYPVINGLAVIEEADFEYWTPEHPVLYDFDLHYGEDLVHAYLGFRDVEVREAGGRPRIFLNGRPYYFHGILDQGYYHDGIFLPEDPAQYEKDLRFLKEAGFNMLRKHIKVEPDLFYYACDRLGIAVFQDMVENGRYHFFRDTVFPTLGFGKYLPDRFLQWNTKKREAFLAGMKATVRQLENHPSIVLWSIFNEGWGQFDGDRAYETLKLLDPTRLIDTASGWFRTKRSDVHSSHVYFRNPKAKAAKKPYVLSEYGGYVWKVKGHSYDETGAYGYGRFGSEEAYTEAVVELFSHVFGLIPEGLSADVYTQLGDVEDETNGLLSYDREVVKIDPARLKNAFDLTKINR